MNSWLISVREDKYDFENAFFESSNSSIVQHQTHNNYEIGDFVYIYCAPSQELRYKCLIIRVNIVPSDIIDDEKYYLDKNFFTERREYKHHMELQFVDKISVSYEEIKKFGKIGMNIQQKMPEKLLQYINDISTSNEINDYFLQKDSVIDSTEKSQILKVRMGQGIFREKVIKIDKKCQITGVENVSLLIASHILSWKNSNDTQRLDGNNGILLSPHLDKLFDKHLISFDDDGKIVTYNEYTKEILHQWGIDTGKKYFDFSNERKEYLKKHREKCEELRS